MKLKLLPLSKNVQAAVTFHAKVLNRYTMASCLFGVGNLVDVAPERRYERWDSKGFVESVAKALEDPSPLLPYHFC